MVVCPCTAWIAAGCGASPVQRGVKSTRDAVVTSGLRRYRRISPVLVAIQTSPSTANDFAVFAAIVLSRYGVAGANATPSVDSCFQSWPEAESSTYRFKVNTARSSADFQVSFLGVTSFT